MEEVETVAIEKHDLKHRFQQILSAFWENSESYESISGKKTDKFSLEKLTTSRSFPDEISMKQIEPLDMEKCELEYH